MRSALAEHAADRRRLGDVIGVVAVPWAFT